METKTGEATNQLNTNERLNTIVEENGFIKVSNGIQLFYRRWMVDQENKDKVLVVIHGIGFHSEPYEIVAQYLCKSGLAVYGVDIRGHGYSEGNRGELPGKAVLASDISYFINFIKDNHPTAKIFLLGESMGSLLALNYVSKFTDFISGLILVAPALKLHSYQFSCDSLRSLFSSFVKTGLNISLMGWRLEVSTRDLGFKQFRAEDSVSLKNVSFSYIYSLWQMNSNWKKKYSLKIKTPTLIIQGDHDKLLDPNAAIKFYKLLGVKDKKIEIISGAYHTLFWDPCAPQVFKIIECWLNSH